MKSKNKLTVIWYVIFLEVIVLVIVLATSYILKYLNKDTVPVGEHVVGSAELVNWDRTKVVKLVSVEAEGEDQMYVVYEPVTGAKGYEIAYQVNNQDWITFVSPDTQYRFYTEFGGMEYSVRVRAYNEEGQYGPYSEVFKTISASRSPVISLVSRDNTSISIQWSQADSQSGYQVYYRKQGTNDWSFYATPDNELTIGGLEWNTNYEFQIAIIGDVKNELISNVVTIMTQTMQYGDPFKNLFGVLKVNGEERSVCFSAAEGCLGTTCWPEYDTTLYTKANQTGVSEVLTGGMEMTITADEQGQYCYQVKEQNWSIHVTGKQGDKEVSGWVQANSMLVDLAQIFPGKSNKYSIQYNRTNAYSSLFTVGGNGLATDTKSAKDTRYNPLNATSSATSLVVRGYNVIDSVTGLKLKNYGSRDCMPAVWDLAMELITCQRNSLKNGTCLLIYESYRPNSTSKLVNQMVTNGLYLKDVVNGMTLANGFLKSNLTESNFIANYSKHNKGIAVDLTIMEYSSVTQLGKEIVMQTKMHTLDYRSCMAYNTADADLLYDIMTQSTGLVCLNGKQEWWHFELSDDAEKFPCINNYKFTDYKL